MPRKKSAAKTPNKTRFVLSLPHDLSAKEVIDKGKAVGLKLTDKYIYSIRSKSKVVGKPKGKPGRPRKVLAAGPTATGHSTNGSAELRLINMALDMGLSKAEALLKSLRENIKRAIG